MLPRNKRSPRRVEQVLADLQEFRRLFQEEHDREPDAYDLLESTKPDGPTLLDQVLTDLGKTCCALSPTGDEAKDLFLRSVEIILSFSKSVAATKS